MQRQKNGTSLSWALIQYSIMREIFQDSPSWPALCHMPILELTIHQQKGWHSDYRVRPKESYPEATGGTQLHGFLEQDQIG